MQTCSTFALLLLCNEANIFTHDELSSQELKEDEKSNKQVFFSVTLQYFTVYFFLVR